MADTASHSLRVMSLFRLLALTALVAPAAALAQPDVVLIVADDLGFGDVGYNGSDIRTPHLDRLAAEGVVLDRFYSTPRCSPSRAGLLTGRYPIRMRINEAIGRADTVGIQPAEVTLAEALHGAGYETAMVGKWHLGVACHQHPMQNGFDSFVGMLGGGANYFHRGAGATLDWWRGLRPDSSAGYTTDLIAEEAVEILSRPRDGPLFLYLPFTAPHTPSQARPEDLARYAGVGEPRRTFAAMTTRLDWGVGRVMDAVRASGRPTLVWFLSDNGAMGWQGGLNAPLRGGKGEAFEGGIRVPSVVWFPEWGPRTVDHPVWYLDVLPTVLGALGAPLPDRPLDGADQSAQLRGAPPTRRLLDRLLYTYARMGEAGYWLAAQNAEWKYVHQPVRPERAEGLYHLAMDPGEQADRLASHPGLASALRDSAFTYAARLMPGASRDDSLVPEIVPNFSACGGAAALPRPVPADSVAQDELDEPGFLAMWGGPAALAVTCLAFTFLAGRLSGKRGEG